MVAISCVDKLKLFEWSFVVHCEPSKPIIHALSQLSLDCAIKLSMYVFQDISNDEIDNISTGNINYTSKQNNSDGRNSNRSISISLYILKSWSPIEERVYTIYCFKRETLRNNFVVPMRMQEIKTRSSVRSIRRGL